MIVPFPVLLGGCGVLYEGSRDRGGKLSDGILHLSRSPASYGSVPIVGNQGKRQDTPRKG
jgi:hypothetical protein